MSTPTQDQEQGTSSNSDQKKKKKKVTCNLMTVNMPKHRAFLVAIFGRRKCVCGDAAGDVPASVLRETQASTDTAPPAPVVVKKCTYGDVSPRPIGWTCDLQPKNQIHESLTCKHYSAICKLIEDNNGEEKELFRLAASGMRVQSIDAIHDTNPADRQVTLDEIRTINSLPTTTDRRFYIEYFNLNLNTREQSKPRFSIALQEKTGIIVNIEADEKGLFGLVNRGGGTNFVRLANPYQATIHELWHSIDRLAGYRKSSVFVPYSNEFQLELRLALHKDFTNRGPRGIHSFYDDINQDILDPNIPDSELYYLCDIVEGNSHCYFNQPGDRFNSTYAPRPNYWRDPNIADPERRSRVGIMCLNSEYFAAIGCMAVANREALNRTNQFLSNSYEVYKKMVNGAIRRVRKRMRNDFKGFV